MKRHLALFAVLSTILCCASASLAAYRGTVSGEGIRVRSSASIRAKVLKRLDLDEKIEVLESVGEGRQQWYKVRTENGVTGWMSGAYLQQPQNVPMKVMESRSLRVKGTNVNIRSGHGRQSKVLGRLSAPAEVAVQDFWGAGQELWYKIRTARGQSGWMSAQFLVRADMPDGTKVTELLQAAEKGNVKKVQALLDAGVPVEGSDQYGRTALMIAARKGSTELVNLLLRAGAKIEASDGTTALDSAASEGHLAVVQQLLDAGAVVDSKWEGSMTDSGMTALEVAVWGGHTGVAELLLNAGADPKAGQEDGHSALWCLEHSEKLSDHDRKYLSDLFAKHMSR